MYSIDFLYNNKKYNIFIVSPLSWPMLNINSGLKVWREELLMARKDDPTENTTVFIVSYIQYFIWMISNWSPLSNLTSDFYFLLKTMKIYSVGWFQQPTKNLKINLTMQKHFSTFLLFIDFHICTSLWYLHDTLNDYLTFFNNWSMSDRVYITHYINCDYIYYLSLRYMYLMQIIFITLKPCCLSDFWAQFTYFY